VTASGAAGSLVAGRYRLERELGSGGMASVHLARDEELERQVAIKLLAVALSADPAFRERFLREAKLAARLSHPNVVSVFDTGEHEGRPFIVMEWVDGETVADLLHRQGALPVGEALAIARQAAAGLAHAHAAGLVHRDVKPHNLLLTGDGAVKIADFGIARAAELTGLTEAGTVLGTAAYLAPEQFAGEVVNEAADVYGLGAVVYQMLAGRPPRRVESLDDLARIRADEPITPLRELRPEVPTAIDAAVMRALAVRPADRQADAARLGRELTDDFVAPRHKVESHETAATAVIPPEATEIVARSHKVERAAAPPTVPPRRIPRAAWAIGAAVLVLVLGVAGALWARDEPPATPAQPEHIDPGETPEQGARNLADWLRANSAADAS
jgi:eukaryotic-like serine/threonine-protein kinase